MGFLNRKFSKKTGRIKCLLELAVSRIAVARRPRLARRSIAFSDVGQLLALGHLDRALHRAEQFIQEDNMLEAFNIVELYCKRLIEQAAQLDKPQECGEDIKEAAAGIIFAARWCGDLPELLFARTTLADKFGSEFAAAAKEGTGATDPTLVWKLSGDTTNWELKKKVTKEIAAENNILVDFSELPEAMKDGNGNGPHREELEPEMSESCKYSMDTSSESDDDHSHSDGMNSSGSGISNSSFGIESNDENVCDTSNSGFILESKDENVRGISNSDKSGDRPLKPKANKKMNCFCIRFKMCTSKISK